jgi:hypothetical protein
VEPHLDAESAQRVGGAATVSNNRFEDSAGADSEKVTFPLPLKAMRYNPINPRKTAA